MRFGPGRLPLYRQSKIFDREGVDIERMVMAE
jgi:hypothetical protein